ncbi:MAG: hypothetical protein K8R90_03690 [Candidatus Cloacimonetes bacterium]|nr:hypothetical protein [Candidatus Cloacimonadota bacterium]
MATLQLRLDELARLLRRPGLLPSWLSDVRADGNRLRMTASQGKWLRFPFTCAILGWKSGRLRVRVASVLSLHRVALLLGQSSLQAHGLSIEGDIISLPIELPDDMLRIIDISQVGDLVTVETDLCRMTPKKRD